MSQPHALIITAAGINCDLELAYAFEAAGAKAERVHINRLIADPALIGNYQLIGLPGGFSFGDAVAAGRIMAQLIRKHLYRALIEAVQRGVPIIAPCNGFQIAVQAGLLPGPSVNGSWPQEPARQVVTLAPNASSRFVDRWARIEIPAQTKCIWTRGLSASESKAMLPVAHGEGRFVADSPERLTQFEADGQIAMRYAPGDNPNGSAADIAGICDASGLIFGLMPHPERSTRLMQHPFWTRLADADRTGDTFGLALFKQAVAWITSGASKSPGSNLSSQTKSDARATTPVRCLS